MAALSRPGAGRSATAFGLLFAEDAGGREVAEGAGGREVAEGAGGREVAEGAGGRKVAEGACGRGVGRADFAAGFASVCGRFGADGLRAGALAGFTADFILLAGFADLTAAALPFPAALWLVLAAGALLAWEAGAVRLPERVRVRAAAGVLRFRSAGVLFWAALDRDFLVVVDFVAISSDPFTASPQMGIKIQHFRGLANRHAAGPSTHPGRNAGPRWGPRFPPRPSHAGVNVGVNSTVIVGIRQCRARRAHHTFWCKTAPIQPYDQRNGVPSEPYLCPDWG